MSLTKKTTIFSVSLIIGSIFGSYAQKKLSLQSAISQALQNNLQIMQSKISEKADDLQLKKSKNSVYPTLNSTISGNFDFGRALDPTTNLYLSSNAFASTQNMVSNVVLISGLQKRNQIKEDNLILEAATDNTEKLKNDLTIQVIATYLGVLSYQDQLTMAQQQGKSALQQLDIENKKFTIGKHKISDVAKSKLQLSKAELSISNLKNQLNLTLADLKQMMNVPPESDFQLINPEDSLTTIKQITSTDIYKNAINTFPEIKRTQLLIKAAQYGVKVAKGNYYPSVSLTGVVASSYLYQFHFQPSLFGPYVQIPFGPQLHSNMYEYIGLTLNIPIFNNFNTRISVKKAENDLQNVIITDKLEKASLTKEINQAIADLKSARSNYTYALESLTTSKTVFEEMKKKYDNGSADVINYSQALDDLDAAEFSIIYNKYNLIFRTKVVQHYLGEPLSY